METGATAKIRHFLTLKQNGTASLNNGVKWMWQFERAPPNCVNPLLFGAFMVRFHSTRGGWSFFIWGSAAGEIFCFGSISTTRQATDKWMRRLERAHLNCVFPILVRVFMVKFHGDGWDLTSQSDLQLARFFVLGIAPPPHELWTNGCGGSKGHAWVM